jgi:GTP-binding protein
VNFFELDEQIRLVDLPGYGYANVSNVLREHWGELLSFYFENRKSLKGLFMIVDIRRGLTEYDRNMLFFAKLQDLPVHILLTKSDKLKRGAAKVKLIEVQKELEKSVTMQLFSSLNRQGLDEARDVLKKFLGTNKIN